MSLQIEPEEVAAVVAFLCGPATGSIRGRQSLGSSRVATIP
ncbi:hypothetical protein [Persicitalea sp.]